MFEILTRKKIIGALVGIIIVTIIVIYYESKVSSNDNFNILDTESKDLNALKNDNKNSNNVTKCWEKESFELVENCSKCDRFYSKTLIACLPTGYREVIKCEKYGMVSRSCAIPIDIKKKHFWLFEFFILIGLLITTTVVVKRKNLLDRQATERVRRQLIADS